MANEKRRARRDKHDSVVEILDEGGTIKAFGRLADFSSSGVSFSSEKIFRKGERLKVRLRLLDRGTLEAEGEVVWAREKSGRAVYGVRFSEVRSVYPTGELRKPWD